mgnify:CR=1 FL=1
MTLKEIMTPQEIFNHVTHHLLTQSKLSEENNGDYMYISSEGLRCSVGCLFEYKDYDPLFEDNSIDCIDPEELPVRITDNLDLVIDLQKVHDDQRKVSLWKEQLHKVAKRYDLDTSVLDLYTWNEQLFKYERIEFLYASAHK